MPRIPTGESSLSRAIRILDAFDHDSRALTVGELAQRARLPVATASRIIAELVNEGFLVRSAERRVQMGMRMWEIAERAAPMLSLRDAARPFLWDLQALIGHHAQLSVLDDGDIICVERVSSRTAVTSYSQIGGRFPFHATSAGLVLLAHSPDFFQNRVLGEPLQRFTTETLTDPALVRSAALAVRNQGYALLRGHVNEEATGISAPVLDRRREVVAALSIIVPNDDRAPAHVPMLIAAARGLSRELQVPRYRTTVGPQFPPPGAGSS